MSARLDKIGSDLAKARAKRDEWDRRTKELERKYREVENTEIQEMVHAANLTPDKLAELLQLIMDKYTFENVEDSWIKMCYYYQHLGPNK